MPRCQVALATLLGATALVACTAEDASNDSSGDAGADAATADATIADGATEAASDATPTDDAYAADAAVCVPAPSVPFDPAWCVDGLSDAVFQSVHGWAKNDVWAVGLGGLVAHFDGHAWSSFPAGDAAGRDLRAVWASGPCDAWAVGDGVYRWDGVSWTRRDARVDAAPGDVVGSVWGSAPDDVYMTTTGLKHFDGVSITDLGLAGGFVWGTAADDVWLLDVHGGVARHFDGHAWSEVAGALVSTPFAASVSGTRDDVWIASAPVGECPQDQLVRWDGAQLHAETACHSCNPISGVFSAAAGDVWVWGTADLPYGFPRHVDDACAARDAGAAPAPYIARMWGLAADDAWGFGAGGFGPSGFDRSVVAHWDGVAWRAAVACGAADAGPDAMDAEATDADASD